MDIIRIIIVFIILLFIVIKTAYGVYKIVSKKIEKERKISEILLMTEEGRYFIKQQEDKRKIYIQKLLPFLYILFIVIILVSVFGSIFLINYFLENDFNNISLDDLKLFVYPGMSIYLIVFLYKFIKNNKAKNDT